MGGGEIARLARPLAASVQGLRGATRGFGSHGHLGHDPPHAPSPRSPEPQAPPRPITFQTGCQSSLSVDLSGLFPRSKLAAEIQIVPVCLQELPHDFEELGPWRVIKRVAILEQV